MNGDEIDVEDVDSAVVDWRGTAENLQREVVRLTAELIETRRAHGCGPMCVHRGGELTPATNA